MSVKIWRKSLPTCTNKRAVSSIAGPQNYAATLKAWQVFKWFRADKKLIETHGFRGTSDQTGVDVSRSAEENEIFIHIYH